MLHIRDLLFCLEPYFSLTFHSAIFIHLKIATEKELSCHILKLGIRDQGVSEVASAEGSERMEGWRVCPVPLSPLWVLCWQSRVSLGF